MPENYYYNSKGMSYNCNKFLWNFTVGGLTDDKPSLVYITYLLNNWQAFIQTDGDLLVYYIYVSYANI